MFESQWKTVTLDYDRSATEFTGDDVDRFTELIDLGNDYEFINVFIPTIDSATVTPYVQRDNAIATVPVVVHILDDDATGSFAHATTAGTGALTCIFRIGGIRWLRLYTGANQTADRTFYVKGFNRLVP
jgi:hypothetical protein